MTQKALNEELRTKFMTLIKESLEQLDHDVLTVNSNEFAVPCLDSEQNDSFITIKVSVPTGTRDGDAYDGYALADEYKVKCEEKAKRAEEMRLTKERKKEQDKKRREKLALSKALHTSSV